MKPIENWRHAHRLWSVRLSAATAALAGAEWLLPNLQGVVPKWAYFALTAAIFAARMIKQERK